MIDIQLINKKYGKQQALKSVSLEFSCGQSVALIGPNGSGKTTLLKSLLGLVVPDEGNINFRGQNILQDFNYRQHIGYMPQISRFPEHLSVNNLFKMIQNMRIDKAEGFDTDLYDQFCIAEMETKSLGSLSGGMRQKVSAALAFYFDPIVLILDEPTAGLDPESNEQLKKKINQSIQGNKLVITTSHILSDLDEIANHVVYMMGAEIVFSGPLQQLKDETSEKTLNKMILKLIDKHTSYV